MRSAMACNPAGRKSSGPPQRRQRTKARSLNGGKPAASDCCSGQEPCCFAEDVMDLKLLARPGQQPPFRQRLASRRLPHLCSRKSARSAWWLRLSAC